MMLAAACVVGISTASAQTRGQFRGLDRNGDGVITRAEMTAAAGAMFDRVDTNRDGNFDFAVFQQEAVGVGSSGQSIVVVHNIATGAAQAFFFTDANFDSATQVLSAPLSALGLTRGSTFEFRVLAYDNYFTGAVTDAILGQSWTVGSSKFALQGGGEQLSVPAGRSLDVTVTRNASAGETTSTGLLFLYDNAATTDAQPVRIS